MAGSDDTIVKITKLLKLLGHDVYSPDWIATRMFPKIAHIVCRTANCNSSYTFQYHLDVVQVFGTVVQGSSDWALQPTMLYGDIRYVQDIPTIHSFSTAPYDPLFYCKRYRMLV